jgi:hypothetical protein
VVVSLATIRVQATNRDREGHAMPDLGQSGVRAHLRYASYVTRHKWFVFRAGLKTRAPLWRLLIHDWSKLSRAEWTPYVWSFWEQSVGRICDCCERRQRPDESAEGWRIDPEEGVDFCPECCAAYEEWVAQYGPVAVED